MDLNGIPMVPAKADHFHVGGNAPVTRVVIHDMEYPEKPDAAEAVARIFSTSSRVASAHYCVDDNSIVQCVPLDSIAYHAPPNTGSVGIEHAGYARQLTGEWLDEFGVAMLRDQSAPLVAALCEKYGLPKVWLSVEDLLAGKKGVTSHNNVSLAFHKSTHTDPGPNFPVAQFMAWVTQGATIPMPKPDPAAPSFEQVFAYGDAMAGGVRVAVADFNGDGKDEIATVPGPGYPAHVRVFDVDPTSGALVELAGFYAFPTDVTVGCFIASGDLDGDGIPEIIVSADHGGGPHVKAFKFADIAHK